MVKARIYLKPPLSTWMIGYGTGTDWHQNRTRETLLHHCVVGPAKANTVNECLNDL